LINRDEYEHLYDELLPLDAFCPATYVLFPTSVLVDVHVALVLQRVLVA
jgi:hypothetical protein